jgi:hypothetical protein
LSGKDTRAAAYQDNAKIFFRPPCNIERKWPSTYCGNAWRAQPGRVDRWRRLFWCFLGNFLRFDKKWPPTNHRKGVRGSQFRFSLVAL